MAQAAEADLAVALPARGAEVVLDREVQLEARASAVQGAKRAAVALAATPAQAVSWAWGAARLAAAETRAEAGGARPGVAGARPGAVAAQVAAAIAVAETQVPGGLLALGAAAAQDRKTRVRFATQAAAPRWLEAQRPVRAILVPR